MATSYRVYKSLLIIKFIVLGGLAAICISILWFPTIPSDFSRTKTLLRFVQKEAKDGSTLVFGNSVTMDGFNANKFTKESCTQNSFNLSSPGQNQLESLLLISSIASKPKQIIHFYLASDLEKQDYLSKEVINNFLLYGYKLDKFSEIALQKTNNASSIADFEMNKLELIFSSRWLLTNYINSNFRKLLRKDLSLDHLSSELYYPRNYTSKFPEEQRKLLVKQFNPKNPISHFTIDSAKLNITKQIGLFALQKKSRYIVVFSPINPELHNYKKSFFSEIDDFCKSQSFSNVQFVNLSTLLAKEDFVDHIHPSESGANKITKELAKILNECSSKQ